MFNPGQTKYINIDFIKLIEIIPDAIVIVNGEGNIKFVNSQIREVFGYSEEELIDKQIEFLMPERYRNNHVRHRHDYNKKPVRRSMGSGLNLFGLRKDGIEIPIDIMLAPIHLGEEKYIISVIRDITKIKETEEEAVSQTRKLEDIINALTHDLKTPLVAAEINYKHLIDGYFGEVNDTQKQILKLLLESNKNALRLVKNLLSVFKYETKSYKLLFEQSNILDLIKKSLNSVRPLIEDKNISVKIPENDFTFFCDSFELERVLINLITNSIKYVKKDLGSIEISASKNDAGTVTVCISDNGQGIPKEDLTKIFDRFWLSRKSNESSQSTGLGLYLCKQIVETHLGKIWAESELNKGTKIFFQIPEILA